MSGIAVELSFERSSVNGTVISSLLKAMPHRGPDGCVIVQDGCCAMGIARRRTTAAVISDQDPFHQSGLGISVVGDVRLDNRDELVTELRGSAPAPLAPMELLALGYQRWGFELASHLEGDFAFALWDSGHRILYAARDPFGTPPLALRFKETASQISDEPAAILRHVWCEKLPSLDQWRDHREH